MALDPDEFDLMAEEDASTPEGRCRSGTSGSTRKSAIACRTGADPAPEEEHNKR